MKGMLQKGLENKFYFVFLAVVTLLIVVFLSSKMWLPDDSRVMQTPFNSQLTGLSQTELMLKQWEYNPDSELMEVTIETKHTGQDIIKPTFTFSANDNTSLVEFPVRVVYDDDKTFVVQVSNVPNKYRVIDFYVKENRDEKILLQEAIEQGGSQKEGSQDQLDVSGNNDVIVKVKPLERILTGDYRKIIVNHTLQTKSATDYQVNNLMRDKQNMVKQIELINGTKIPFEEEVVALLNSEIEVIKANMEYETDEQKRESEMEISNKEGSIEESNKKKDELGELVLQLKERIVLLDKKLKDVAVGNDGEKKMSDEVQEINEVNDGE